MHIRTWCYAVLCLFLPITLPAQKEHKYLDHALPEAWQENDSDFQQTLPVDDQWWKNFNDPTLDSLTKMFRNIRSSPSLHIIFFICERGMSLRQILPYKLLIF